MISTEKPIATVERNAPTNFPGIEALERYVPLLVWLLVLVTLLSIPGKILSYGYIPADDALRHAAKAVSGKPWPEILVMRDDFGIDPHPGWHALLGLVHRTFNVSTEGLVVLEVCGLMLLISAVVVPWLRRPESWIAAMLAITICIPRSSTRFTLGRPYLFTVAAFILLLFIWSRIGRRRPKLWEVGVTLLVIALDAWIHGGWYQMGLPIAALVLCGFWQTAFYYGVCWIAGSFLGCGFTGHPWQFFYQSARHLVGVFGDFHVDRELSSELLPSGGDAVMVLGVAAVILWRSRAPGWKPRDLLNPFFMMGVVGWVLGLKMYRFWDDWGLPSIAVWLALELQKQFEMLLALDSFKRLLLALGLCGSLFLGFTSDISSRYTWNLTNEYLTQDNPELAGWLPDKGGILYSADMEVFFQTFYKNPTAPWRYILGFEPALMRPEDLAVLRKVQWNYGDVRAYEPWVKQMRPEDRLVVRASKLRTGAQPNIPQLEWYYAVSDLWIGRLPRSSNAAPSSPM